MAEIDDLMKKLVRSLEDGGYDLGSLGDLPPDPGQKETKAHEPGDGWLPTDPGRRETGLREHDLPPDPARHES